MQSLLLKLQADIAARKQPQHDTRPAIRRALIITFFLVLAFQFGAYRMTATAKPAVDPQERILTLQAQLDSYRGEVAFQRLQIERLERIYEHSLRYGIAVDLAATIEEIALAESIDPELAFNLIRVESNFDRRAVSSMGAIGYTQIMPATAEMLEPGIRRQELFDPDTNLRLGFRYLHEMLRQYDGDTRLALLAYNRGPTRVNQLLARGIDPGNGYARAVLGK